MQLALQEPLGTLSLWPTPLGTAGPSSPRPHTVPGHHRPCGPAGALGVSVRPHVREDPTRLEMKSLSFCLLQEKRYVTGTKL